MKKLETGLYRFSPSDLTVFMHSPYASWMAHASQEDNHFKGLKDEADGMMSALQAKGYAHEEAYFEHLIADSSKTYINVEKTVGKFNVDLAIEQTIDSMKSGVDIIFQGCLAKGSFQGYSDFLIKVDGRSDLGDYHYEVWDTKLSKNIKPYFIIQLCAYAEMLEAIQGIKPKSVSVVLGNNEKIDFKSDEFYFSYLTLKKHFLALHNAFDVNQSILPEEVKSWGDWSQHAKSVLLEKDHLSQVATLSRSQLIKFNNAGIMTMTQLAALSEETPIPKMQPDIVSRLINQARLQMETKALQAKGIEQPVFEVLPHDTQANKGLQALPPHSPLDVFFDIEGDPMHKNGLEYLWGATYFNENGERDFIDFWAHDHEQEKLAFKGFIDWAYARWKQDPSMHIYHYANYEIAACRRLMGRYGVCEAQVDTLLRNNVFIDLYNVVKQGILLGEPRYSIKNVEHIYRGKRDTDVASGGESVVVYEAWRDNPDGLTWQTSEVLKNIRDYNIDDCDSTQELVDWLRQLQVVHNLPYQTNKAEQEKLPDEDKIERDLKKQALHDALMVKADALKETDLTQSKISALLAELLFFFDREAKPVWWKMFARFSQEINALHDDIDCIANAVRTKSKPYKDSPRARNLCYEYQLEVDQAFKVPRIKKLGKPFYLHSEPSTKLNMVAFDVETNCFVIKAKEEPEEVISLIPDEFVNPRPIPEAILAVAEDYFQEGGDTAFLKFLRKDASQSHILLDRISLEEDSEQRIKIMIELLITLDNGFLAIQGPPGAGKTFTAKHLITSLVKAGKRIAISSNSHKAIYNLMSAVAKQATATGDEFLMLHTNETDAEAGEKLGIQYLNTNAQIVDYLDDSSEGMVVGTTAWGFSREDVAGKFDYLFVDEAGQVSLANLAGMSRSAENIILLGDQMQLGQPIQGSHPGETGLSVLEYLLGEDQTIPTDLGVFLGTTYRMHPDINNYISQAFYDRRLKAAEQCSNQCIKIVKPCSKFQINKSTGLIYVPVEHQGNRQASTEEADKIADIKDALIGQVFTDQQGNDRLITLEDILFIAPYNHQVSTLKKRLGEDANVGSVDLFQGQEAPVIILSMCSSNANDSIRGLEFLLNPNRLNVAISRAQALAIVVASSTLVEAGYGSISSIKQINTFEMLIHQAS